MKTIIRIVIIFLSLVYTTVCSAQMQLNMSLLSHWTDKTLPTNSYGRFNDCWGYVDSNEREYAIIGSTMGTHIFNITNASSPALVSFQPGREASGNVIHRDFKTYQHYLYAVCDEGNSSLQIFDLQYMPDSVHKVYDSQALCKTAHNIFIDHARIYFCGLNDGTNPITFRVASLANPENPVLINDLTSPLFSYVHDACVRNDTAFLSAGYDGLFIYDYTKPYAPALIGSLTKYPEQGYNHSSWITADGKTLVFADETHGTGLKVYDISDMNNITLKSIFRSNLLNDPKKQSIPHNPFILGNKVFISYYQDGIQCFDISNTSSPFQAGYYDTHPSDTSYVGYGPGAWGVYPYLPSKHIIGSDIENGLFILDGSLLVGVNDKVNPESDVLIFPNPINQMLTVKSSEQNMKELKIDIYDDLGKIILSIPSYTSGKPIDISYFDAGIYFMNVSGSGYHVSKKIIKTN